MGSCLQIVDTFSYSPLGIALFDRGGQCNSVIEVKRDQPLSTRGVTSTATLLLQSGGGENNWMVAVVL